MKEMKKKKKKVEDKKRKLKKKKKKIMNPRPIRYSYNVPVSVHRYGPRGWRSI